LSLQKLDASGNDLFGAYIFVVARLAQSTSAVSFFEVCVLVVRVYGSLVEVQKLCSSALQDPHRRNARMKKLCLLLLMAFCLGYAPRMAGQSADPIFAKGELSTTKNHTGDIWLSELSQGDATFDSTIAQAVYGPNARLYWHIHPGGQVLLITEGEGFYQERGQPIRKVHKGEIIRCQPGVEHWHGSTPTSSFTYIAVTPTQKGKTVWLEPVSDQDSQSAR